MQWYIKERVITNMFLNRMIFILNINYPSHGLKPIFGKQMGQRGGQKWGANSKKHTCKLTSGNILFSTFIYKKQNSIIWKCSEQIKLVSLHHVLPSRLDHCAISLSRSLLIPASWPFYVPPSLMFIPYPSLLPASIDHPSQGVHTGGYGELEKWKVTIGKMSQE